MPASSNLLPLIIAVRAKPSSKKQMAPLWQIQSDGQKALIISVSAPAVEGKANAAICSALADFLELRKSQITLHSGQTSKLKRFCVDCDNPAEQARLTALLDSLPIA
jgi:uncharacterized protein YggU (UPF0235/DUF167 family)